MVGLKCGSPTALGLPVSRSKGRCTCWPKGGILMETAVIEVGTGGGACSSGGWMAGASGGA